MRGVQRGSSRRRQWPHALLLLLAVTYTAAPAAAAISRGAKHKLINAIESHPSRDPLNELDQKTKKQWSKDVGLHINDTIRQFLDIPVRITIEVRLVGFDGVTTPHLLIHDHDLHAHFATLRSDMDTVALYPVLEAMNVYPQFQWIVTHDNSGLVNQIEGVIRRELTDHPQAAPEGQESFRQTPAAIPHHIVDNIINRDPYRPDCAGTHYVARVPRGGPAPGRPHDDRYAWIDVTAGPVTYGPGLGKSGYVYEHSFPNPNNFRHESLPKALTPHLAALAWSAAQHLVWPPLLHSQVVYKEKTIVQVIHIHERMTHQESRFDKNILLNVMQDMLGAHQSVEIRQVFLPMASCPLCVEAYVSSVKVRTGRDAGSLLMVRTASRVIDPEAMYRFLSRYRDGIFGYAGVHLEEHEADARVLPVFIWAMRGQSHEPILFTDNRQAVAYPDMVMAVTSHAGVFTTGSVCSYAHTMTDSLDPTRAVVAGLLEAGWGMVNSSTHYTPVTGVGQDYTWALTSNPWGYLSRDTHVSGVAADVLARNLVLSHLNASTSRIVSLLSGFAMLSQDGKFDLYSTGEQKERILARVNVALFKLQHTVTRMELAEYWQALNFARSLDADVRALERLALRVAKSTRAYLHCESQKGLMSVWWAPVGAAGMWVVAALMRGRIVHKVGKDH